MLGGLAARIRGPGRALYAALFAVDAGVGDPPGGFDWDWQMPAVTLGVFMLAGLALARPRDGKVGFTGLPAARTFVAIGWLVLALAPLLVSTSYARLHRSAQALAHGECPSAKHDALSSLSLSARRPQPYMIVGICDLEQGFAQPPFPRWPRPPALEPRAGKTILAGRRARRRPASTRTPRSRARSR